MSTPSVEPVPLPAKRRVAQLAMLAFAVVIVMVAYANVGLAIDKRSRRACSPTAWAWAGSMLAAYLVLAKFAPWADPLILPLVTLVNGLGLVMIYRLEASAQQSPARASASTQLMWTGVGVVDVRRRR